MGNRGKQYWGTFFPKEEFADRVLLVGGPETCNSVNMLRLTESLFCQYPDAAKASYYERVLFNHILSAYDPEKGMCCYFTSMRPGHYRIYASRDSSFGAVDILVWRVRQNLASLFIVIQRELLMEILILESICLYLLFFSGKKKE